MFKARHLIAVAAAALLVLGSGSVASAFHAGGVAHCDGCHTMHNSVDGQEVTANPNSSLLKASDPSSTCLQCHYSTRTGSYHILSDTGGNLTPGGDFFWTTVDVTWNVRGNDVTRNGYGNGHSVVAEDFPNIQQEGVLTAAPGGSFPAASLGCQSCHDPHGTIPNKTLPIAGSGSFGDPTPTGAILGNYRLLGTTSYNPKGTNVTFVNPAPIARALPNSNNVEADDHHADYGQGTAEWCANCHAGLQVSGTGVTKHPTGGSVKLGDFVSNYNSYVASGNTTGAFSDAYFALVPIERSVSDRTLLNTDTRDGATDGQDNVTCLTCHRAHASAFANGTRWDAEVELLVESHPQATDTVSRGDAATLALNSYYGRDISTAYGEFQRSLCNKCHLKD